MSTVQLPLSNWAPVPQQTAPCCSPSYAGDCLMAGPCPPPDFPPGVPISFDCQHGGFVNWPVFLYHIQTHHMSPFHLTIETVPARSVVAHTQRYAPPPPPTHPLVPAPRQPYNAAHNQAVAPTPMLAEAFVGPPRLEMARPSHHAEGAFVAQGSSGPPSDAAASPTRTASSSAAVGPAHIVETVYRDPRNRKELNAQVNKLAHRAEALSGAHGNPNKLNIQCPIQGQKFRGKGKNQKEKREPKGPSPVVINQKPNDPPATNVSRATANLPSSDPNVFQQLPSARQLFPDIKFPSRA
ncbi:hypothetical protein SISNIDRAFT_480467 [Sistotremastrum niveocremeum HHB9708]|uniref:Uncharacterized protein n=1 Tax=Sistotremastrum niveocremeum HHB9708 TaxID=1314777 RepID=A0A165AE91_9AGAM|nr:hypothetical protein SISNIDRAFT_480467 [Sistotremastrum niveocremeum HHB9708]